VTRAFLFFALCLAVADASAAPGLAASVARDNELAGNPEVIRYLALTSESARREALPRGTVAEPFAYEPEWITGPKGLPVLRSASSLQNQRLISWFLRVSRRRKRCTRAIAS
jgi:hypothetical protein